MIKNEEMTEFFATIIVGDEYHSIGEEYNIFKYNLETIKNEGLRLVIEDDRFRRDKTFFHIYPVKIEKRIYNVVGRLLVCTSVETIEGGDRSNCKSWAGIIGEDSYKNEDPNEWMEHWP